MVKDILDVALIPLLVGVDEDKIECAVEFLQGFAGWALDQLDAIIEVVLVESLAAGSNHFWVKLKSDDLGLGLLSRLVPSQGTVSSVASNLKD